MTENHHASEQRHYQLWNETGLKNIKPDSVRYGEYPEGWDVIKDINRIINPFIQSRILEIGCGYGRICRAFSPKQYLGMDINAQAITRAKTLFPQYKFQHAQYVDKYPDADVVFAYTVFLHMPEHTVHDVIKNLGNGVEHVFIAEIMEKKTWDQNTQNNYDDAERFHAVYQRTPEEYVKLMEQHRYYLSEEIIKPYHYYAGAKIHFLHFRKMPAPPKILCHQAEWLKDPHLQFTGLYEDGWVHPHFSITLSNTVDDAHLVIEGLYPANPDLRSNITLEIRNETKQLLYASLNPGHFNFKSNEHMKAGIYHLDVSIHPGVDLPPPDARHVGFFLKKIGFESNSSGSGNVVKKIYNKFRLKIVRK